MAHVFVDPTRYVTVGLQRNFTINMIKSFFSFVCKRTRVTNAVALSAHHKHLKRESFEPYRMEQAKHV